MKRIKIFLSERGTSILFTLISIIAINCWQQVLPNLDYDNSFSLAAAKNIAEGHGYSIKTASAEDLSKFYYDPLNKWPPGYSWLLVIAHYFFGNDWIQASFILNAFGLTALVLVLRTLLFQLEYPKWMVNTAILYFGFLLHPFHYSYYADIFGLLFFLCALIFLIRVVKTGKNVLWMSLFSAISLGFCTYLKYLYLPLSFMPILALFIYGYYLKRKDFQFAALRAFFLLTLIILSLLLFQYSNSGRMLFIHPSRTGFFPDQLLQISSVIPNGFVNMRFVNMQLSIILHVSFITLRSFWLIFYLYCMSWLAYTGLKLLRSRNLKIIDFKSFYAIQAILFTGVLFIYLLVFTVTKSKHYNDTFFDWVYGQELRYYSVFIIFVFQFILFLFLKKDLYFSKAGKLFFCFTVFLCMIVEISHGTYFLTRAVVQKRYGRRVVADQFLYHSMDLTKKIKLRNGNVIVYSNNYAIANMCGLEGVPVYFDIGKLQVPVASKSPVTLLIAVDATVPGGSLPLLLNPPVKPDYVFYNVSYYILHISKSRYF